MFLLSNHVIAGLINPFNVKHDYMYDRFNPLSPHDGLRHHSTSLKTTEFSYNEGF